MTNQQAQEVTMEVVRTIGEVLKPEQVFDTEQLEDWAEKNGYVKTE